MILMEGDKSRARIHMGVPVLGIQDSGFSLGYRFTNVIGLFEYRMNNLQPWEISKLLGVPIASMSVMGTPAVGQTITCTVASLAPVTYTLTSQDLAQPDPIYCAANNFANAFNAINGATYIASAQPTVYWPAPNSGTQSVGFGPEQWQIAFNQLNSQSPFTITPSSSGLVVAVTSQGASVSPGFTFKEGDVSAYGYLAICDYLQSQTAGSSDLAKFQVADVVTMRYDEIGYREAIYQNWRQKLADYFGIPLFPMKNSGPTRFTGLTI